MSGDLWSESGVSVECGVWSGVEWSGVEVEWRRRGRVPSLGLAPLLQMRQLAKRRSSAPSIGISTLAMSLNQVALTRRGLAN
jgi:hypothetical protein